MCPRFITQEMNIHVCIYQLILIHKAAVWEEGTKAHYCFNNCIQEKFGPLTVLHTENVARGGKLSFQNVGGQRCIQCTNFSKV